VKLQVAIVIAAVALLPQQLARGAEPATLPPGKGAARAALSAGAVMPVAPPQLPVQASDRAREALSGRNADTAGRAHEQAALRAADEASAARAEAANNAAQASVAAAAGSAAADLRAAAGQARATAAKSKASGHSPASGGRP
jgi:hypothetical protein